MDTQSIIKQTRKKIARLIINQVRKKIAKEEFGYLRQDWEPLKHCFVATFTISPFAIFGIILFGLAIIVSFIFALARIMLNF